MYTDNIERLKKEARLRQRCTIEYWEHLTNEDENALNSQEYKFYKELDIDEMYNA